MFSGFGLTELLVILAIVLLIFGPKRLKSLGSDLGSAIKGFRTAVSDDENKAASADTQQEKVIEGQVNQTESTTTETKQNSNA
jgi:sec-independent protein translocase protein TatA